MRGLTWSIAPILALAASAAAASTPSVEIDLTRPATAWEYGDEVVVLPAPPGYCFPEQLVVHYQADSLLVFSLNQWASNKGRIHLAIAIDCRELAALRRDLTRGFSRYVVWSAEAARNREPRRLASDRTDYAETVVQAGPHVPFTTVAVGLQRFTEGVPDERATTVTALEGRALARDPVAAYTAIVQSVTAGDRERTVAGVYAATLVNGIPVTLETYAPDDGAAIDRLEEQARATVAAFMAANPDSEASRFANVNWYRVATGSLFGAAVGGAIGLLGKIARGRRKAKV